VRLVRARSKFKVKQIQEKCRSYAFLVVHSLINEILNTVIDVGISNFIDL
jgi:hypothetical protein